MSDAQQMVSFLSQSQVLLNISKKNFGVRPCLYHGADLYERSLRGNERIVGKGHPNTLTTLHNMAHLFESRGDIERALELFKNIISVEESNSQKYHPNTLSTLQCTAEIYFKMNQVIVA